MNANRKFIMMIALVGLTFIALIPFKLAFPLAYGMIILSLGFYYPSFALYGTLLAFPFMPDVVALIMMMGSAALVFISRWLKGENLIDVVIPLWSIALFALICVFNTVTSINFMGSMRDLGLNLVAMFFMIGLMQGLQEEGQVYRAATWMLAGAFFVSLVGLYQYRTGVTIDQAWLDVENNPDVKARVYSVFANPNILAEYLIMTIPLGVALFWTSKHYGKKLFFICVTGILVLSLVLTMSRGGWVGFAISAIIFLLLVNPKWFYGVIPGIFLVFSLLPQSIANRVMSIGNLADSSNLYRFKIWSITREIIENYWSAGVGFGHKPYKQVFESYIRTMPIYHAHNTFLETAAEQGVPGVIIFVAMLLIILKYSRLVILTADKQSFTYVMGSALIASLVGILAHGMFENILYIPRIIFTFWMIVGLLLALYTQQLHTQKEIFILEKRKKALLS